MLLLDSYSTIITSLIYLVMLIRKHVSYLLLIITFLFLTSLAVSAQDGASTNTKKKKLALSKESKKSRKAKSGHGEDSLVYSGKSRTMAVNLSSKKNEYIIIDWVQPSGANVPLQNGAVDVKVKIISSEVIRNENVAVYHNQQRLGSRMDVSGLFGDQKEFNYSNRVELTEGVNEIIIKVTTAKQDRSSDPLVLYKKGKTVSVQPMGASSAKANPLTNIYWWTTYDPVTLKGKPFTSKERILPVRFKILTTEELNAGLVSIHHNGKIVKPGPKSAMEKDYQGNYSFSDEVNLVESAGLNEIYLEIRTPSSVVRSEKLLVDFSPLRPNLHILSIGTETNLQYTLKDARDFAKLFANQGGNSGNRIFNKILLDTLIGDKATAQEIKGTIEELKVRYYTGSISTDDVILAFISSHGFLLNGDFRVQGDDYSPARQRSTSVSFKSEVVSILESIPCKKIIMIDACHSGGARANPSDINFEINKLNSIEKGLTVFASSRGEEQSYEDPVWQNGAFTETIIKALSDGKADADGNRIVSLHELNTYVSKEVAAIVKNVKKRPQNPILVNDELGDVAIYVLDR